MRDLSIRGKYHLISVISSSLLLSFRTDICTYIYASFCLARGFDGNLYSLPPTPSATVPVPHILFCLSSRRRVACFVETTFGAC
jgi:hypothetical protein